MSPIGPKSDIEKRSKMEKTAVKHHSSLSKFTPLKDCTNKINQLSNSADKARKRQVDCPNQEGTDLDKSENYDASDHKIQFKLTKVSQSAEKHRKFISKIKKVEQRKAKKLDRSPLIPNHKVEGGLLSENSSELGNNILPDSDPVHRSSNNSHRTFSPKKALDFADKSAEYKGRNLFEDNYQ